MLWNCIFFSSNVGSMARQLNVNALNHNSGLLSFPPHPFSPLSPLPFLISLNLSLSLSVSLSLSLASSLPSEPSQIFLLLVTILPSTPVSVFSPLRILMMAGLSQFSHHLRLICDTQLGQLKPLMAQRSTQGCQSCQPWNIPACCITWLVKEQGSWCMKFKRRLREKRWRWESRSC